jgi:hypothetical protein
MSSHTPLCYCLACGAKLNAVTATDDDDDPSSGAITLCFYCGHIMALTDELTVRPLTDEEMLAVAGDKTVLAAQKARAAYALLKRESNDDE